MPIANRNCFHTMTKVELAQREVKLLLVPLFIVLTPVLIIFGGLPYGFYILLRFVVFFVLGYLAWQHRKLDQTDSVWLLAPIALLFNPIFPFALGGPLWIVVDIITASILFVRRRRIIRNLSHGTIQI